MCAGHPVPAGFNRNIHGAKADALALRRFASFGTHCGNESRRIMLHGALMSPNPHAGDTRHPATSAPAISPTVRSINVMDSLGENQLKSLISALQPQAAPAQSQRRHVIEHEPDAANVARLRPPGWRST